VTDRGEGVKIIGKSADVVLDSPLSVRPGLLYQYKKVALALLSVQRTQNEVCTENFCTDSESDKGGGVSLSVLY